jgi:hypothetical protein
MRLAQRPEKIPGLPAATTTRQTERVVHDFKDSETLARIHDLVTQEKELRAKLQNHEIGESDENVRLRAIETELDQCWDLLRQRRALRDTGGDPREANVRPADQVEGYTG